MKKIILNTAVCIITAAIVIPASINSFFYYKIGTSAKEEPLGNIITYDSSSSNEDISSNESNNIEIPENMEEYIVGVVAAEMPASFEEEALKAQAVAARTYAVNKNIPVDELITDGGQAYCSIDDMKEKWGSNFDLYYEKIRSAVYDTEGEIVVYNNEPILAVFHAISGGKTEDCQNVWSEDLPYLKSVDSSVDESADEYYCEVSIPSNTVASTLQSYYSKLKITEGSLVDQMQILERTDAGYVDKIQVGNMILSGKQIREALGLRSSNFTYEQDGDNIIFKTKGYGHGAGMSQYGANVMAQEGKNYKEILAYYYTATEIKKYD
jgi:stage II sporulation protein D